MPCNILTLVLSGLLDSNQRPHRPERRALPTALNPDVLAPMVIKTMQRYTKNCIKPNKKALFYLFCKLFHRKIWWNRFLLLPLHPQMRNHLQRVWCHSSVGRAKDWKSLCPRFDSWWYHFKKPNFRNEVRLFVCYNP